MYFHIYNPFVYQGNLRNKHYFEGWYFKHISADQKNIFSVIPGISLNCTDSHSFIQILDGITGLSEYIRYPVSEFQFDYRKASLKVGKSIFSQKSVILNIDDEKTEITGEIQYYNLVKYPSSIFSPGIMGWYSFVPYMECKHGIISVNHNLTGKLKINGNSAEFDNGKGYIEKDWGTSFPEAWIWLQANNFKNSESSFSFSIAKIPWRRNFFIGFIAYLYYNKKFYLFSTYNNSAISEIHHSGNSINFILKNKKTTLKVSAQISKSGDLIAPVSGQMSRRIKESIDSEVSLTFFDQFNNLIYSDLNNRAGIEVTDNIFNFI
jgi:tocopherol cyclase